MTAIATTVATNEHWTTKHDALLSSWRKQALLNLGICSASSLFYRRTNAWLTYPAIVLSGVTSVSVFGVDNTFEGKLVLAVLALTTGVLASINKQVHAAEKAQDFHLRSKDFYKIIRDIEYVLSLEFQDRPALTETMIRLRNAMDRVMDMVLDPPASVIKRYELYGVDQDSSLRAQVSSVSQSRHPRQSPGWRKSPAGRLPRTVGHASLCDLHSAIADEHMQQQTTQRQNDDYVSIRYPDKTATEVIPIPEDETIDPSILQFIHVDNHETDNRIRTSANISQHRQIAYVPVSNKPTLASDERV